jgi:uncharacterized protein YndB with AHSA1/START domain
MSNSSHEIVIDRMFDAPRERVWPGYTDADQIARWFGPRGFSTRVEAWDFRVGGRWRLVMIGPDGNEYPSEGVFKQIVPGRRYVTTDEFGEDFTLPGVDLPQGIVTTIDFEDASDGAPAGQTRLIVRIAHPSDEERRKHEAMGVVAGFESMLECFAEHLAHQVDSGSPVTRTSV